VVDEAFVCLESYARKHEIRSAAEAFLVTTAVNLGRDQAKDREGTPVDNTEFDILRLADTAPLPEEQLLSKERLRRIGSGLRRLDPTTRRILLAKRLDVPTAAQLAEREDMSVAAVERRATRCFLELQCMSL
jgi:RNA polymerase sigma-70 factor (ECF subfamily)